MAKKCSRTGSTRSSSTIGTAISAEVAPAANVAVPPAPPAWSESSAKSSPAGGAAFRLTIKAVEVALSDAAANT